MLSYRPDGALSPRLARIMRLLFKVIQKEDLMASLMISDGKHGEFHISVDPTWSCCTMDRIPGGDISVRFKSERANYESRAEQKKHMEQTVNGLALMFKMNQDNNNNLMAVLGDLKKVISFSHYDEEYKAHGADPPDPDKVPATLEEAAELIFATMDKDMLKWARATPLYEAMPAIHHGFGRTLRNSWSLHEPGTPLNSHVRERLGIFGHGDDLTTLIFTTLWGRVNGEPKEVTEQALQLEVEGMREHWKKMGINPATGEQSLIMP